MSFRDSLVRRAGRLEGEILLVEGWDERVTEAASKLEALGMAVSSLERDCSGHARVDDVARLVMTNKPHRFGSMEAARGFAEDPVNLGAGLVALGEYACAVAGATCPTGSVVRGALATVGIAPGIETVSSSFYMEVPGRGASAWWGADDDTVLTFTDAGVVPAPTVDQLVEIAAAAAHDRGRIVGDEPSVAFLSYSTKGSAEGESVDLMRAAAQRFAAANPDLEVDGELQGDAALVPGIAARKAPGSAVAGRANVLVFPDLDAGNIAYKLVQRLGGAAAVGPILQGLARPVADLSRGASPDDIVDVALVALLQSGNHRKGE